MKLFLEIKDKNLFFVAGEYNENLDFIVIEKLEVNATGIQDGKIINIEKISEILKYSLEQIEIKVKYTFKYINIILNQKKIDCINVTGFKKLNGSLILKEDISHIINNLQKSILETEVNKKIIHVFNTKYNLDNIEIKNLPIGLYGELYVHQLTFFLLNINDFKNIKLLLNRCNLNLGRIILKPYTDGVNLIKKNKDLETFININLEKDNIDITIFNNLSFSYYQNFKFGFEIIIKDLIKVCSLQYESALKILSEVNISNIAVEYRQEFIDKKYFINESYRKISISHVKNIVEDRVEELVNIIYNKNINLHLLKSTNVKVFITTDSSNFIKNLKDIFLNSFTNKEIVDMTLKTRDEHLDSCLAAAYLVNNGWSKEAIPFTKNKETLISRIFAKLFS